MVVVVQGSTKVYGVYVNASGLANTLIRRVSGYLLYPTSVLYSLYHGIVNELSSRDVGAVLRDRSFTRLYTSVAKVYHGVARPNLYGNRLLVRNKILRYRRRNRSLNGTNQVSLFVSTLIVGGGSYIYVRRSANV